MLQRSTKILAIISTVILLVSVSAFAGFYVFIEKGKELYMSQELERAQAEKDQELFKALTSSLEETKDARLSLESRIIKEEEVINLLTLIETVGREQGLELTTGSLNAAPMGKYESLLLDVQMKGSYDAMLHMLTLLEHLPYQTIVRGVQFTSTESGVWTGTVALSVTKYKKP